jgi:hypothetical protein
MYNNVFDDEDILYDHMQNVVMLSLRVYRPYSESIGRNSTYLESEKYVNLENGLLGLVYWFWGLLTSFPRRALDKTCDNLFFSVCGLGQDTFTLVGPKWARRFSIIQLGSATPRKTNRQVTYPMPTSRKTSGNVS